MPVEIRQSAQKTDLVGSDGLIYGLELDLINKKITVSYANGVKIQDKETLVRISALAEVLQAVVGIADAQFNPPAPDPAPPTP